MIWGSQYDAMLNWAKQGMDKDKIINTSLGNNNSEKVATTGNSKYSRDSINNIRDLGGNEEEFTLEAYTAYGRVYRGGFVASCNSPSFRNGNITNPTFGSPGSRLTLYIK